MQGLGSEASQAYNVNNMPQAWGPYIFLQHIFLVLFQKERGRERFPPHFISHRFHHRRKCVLG